MKRGRIIIPTGDASNTEELGIVDANVLEPKMQRILDALENKLHSERAFLRQVEGYGLTTAQIFFRFPDYQSILYWMLWQEYDIHPDYPRLQQFLNFWQENIEGPLHSVDVAHGRMISRREIKVTDGEVRLH